MRRFKSRIGKHKKKKPAFECRLGDTQDGDAVR
jgi:hypothetical protein